MKKLTLYIFLIVFATIVRAQINYDSLELIQDDSIKASFNAQFHSGYKYSLFVSSPVFNSLYSQSMEGPSRRQTKYKSTCDVYGNRILLKKQSSTSGFSNSDLKKLGTTVLFLVTLAFITSNL